MVHVEARGFLLIILVTGDYIRIRYTMNAVAVSFRMPDRQCLQAATDSCSSDVRAYANDVVFITADMEPVAGGGALVQPEVSDEEYLAGSDNLEYDDGSVAFTIPAVKRTLASHCVWWHILWKG